MVDRIDFVALAHNDQDMGLFSAYLTTNEMNLEKSDYQELYLIIKSRLNELPIKSERFQKTKELLKKLKYQLEKLPAMDDVIKPKIEIKSDLKTPYR